MRYVDNALWFVHLIVSMYTKQVSFTDEEIHTAEHIIDQITDFFDVVYSNHDDLN